MKTPCKQKTLPSPPPFRTDHGRISNFQSVNLLTMQPFILIQKIDTLQSKCTYGFNKTTIISMKPKISLWTGFLLYFVHTQPTNQSKISSTKVQCTSSSQHQNNRHCYVVCSRINNRSRFHKWKIFCDHFHFPSLNGPHPIFNTNSIWQHCQEWHHHWHSFTTQTQSYGHAILFDLLLILTKTIACSLEAKKNLSDY